MFWLTEVRVQNGPATLRSIPLGPWQTVYYGRDEQQARTAFTDEEVKGMTNTASNTDPYDRWIAREVRLSHGFVRSMQVDLHVYWNMRRW